MKWFWLVTWLIISTSVMAETPKFQPPCSFFVNKILDVINFPWNNKDLAPIRIYKVIQLQKNK